MEVQWYRFVDEQPPIEGMYIICSDTLLVATAWWNGEAWHVLPGEGAVTHWMELPPPPKKETSNENS